MAAIPTLYRGIQMRSRLEAKWAAFFDVMGWPWQYEPTDLKGWIPDFYLNCPAFSKPVLVDVKPFVERVERATQIKIEQALGAPLPEELRTPNSPTPHPDDWDLFFRDLKWDILIVGAWPLRRGIDLIRDFEYPDGTLYLGWQFDEYHCWWPTCSVDSYKMYVAWKEATNKVQWKAPR